MYLTKLECPGNRRSMAFQTQNDSYRKCCGDVSVECGCPVQASLAAVRPLVLCDSIFEC